MINTNLLCENIAIARKNNGLTQSQLAEKLGVSAQAVSKWERGISCPDISLLDEIANALNLSLQGLLGISKEGTNQIQ